MNTAPTMVTQKMLFEKLLTVEEKLDKILSKEAEYSIEEVSLYRAAKLLKRSPETVIAEVKAGRLKAMTYRDGKRKKRYRFRIVDIREYQTSKEYDHISVYADDYETAEDLADRIFPGRKK